MNRIVLGAAIALLLAGVGLVWWQGRAQVERGAPPPLPAGPARAAAEDLPLADAAGQRGPDPPVAAELTREQQRFMRYDRNRDWRITRAEMLSTRTDGFRRLDADGNNLLTFEEWAVSTVRRFEGLDRDGDGRLTLAEFALLRPEPRRTPSCRC